MYNIECMTCLFILMAFKILTLTVNIFVKIELNLKGKICENWPMQKCSLFDLGSY